MTQSDQAPLPVASQRERYWRNALRITGVLLAAWFGVTFGILYFARELSTITLFGWPFSFFMAAQGLTLFYLLLVAVYVYLMQRLDNAVRDEEADGT